MFRPDRLGDILVDGPVEIERLADALRKVANGQLQLQLAHQGVAIELDVAHGNKTRHALDAQRAIAYATLSN